jgi:lipopolysaccharide/colanic/teichoic acid biosynthesis glycosyltransferase
VRFTYRTRLQKTSLGGMVEGQVASSVRPGVPSERPYNGQGSGPARISRGGIVLSATSDDNVIGRNGSRVRAEARDAESTARTPAVQRLVKNGLDFIVAGMMIVILAPVLVIVGALVALEGGWPIIYRRQVAGTDGEFDAFKFRTMRRDADAILASDHSLKAEFEENFKLKNDPRLTRLGSFLRRSSLDELPQLFNVLKGQMSLVGPRMKTAVEVERYGNYKALLRTVKPGITGYWQVHGRQATSYEERIRMDMYYIQNWSLGMDLRILIKTPLKVLRREGAY